MVGKQRRTADLPQIYLDACPLASHSPLVSIIVDNYNYADFLTAAINSALDQTYRNVEVVVVDDGSTDSSPAIIESFGSRVTPVMKCNGGQASAFNAGFARCSGEIAIFLDADDVLLPHAVARVVEEFRKDPGLAKIHYRMAVIDAEDRCSGAEKPPAHVHMVDGDLRLHYLTFPDDVWRLPTSGNAFAAEVLRQILPIDEAEYRGGADTYLTHIAPLYGRVRFVDTVCAHYRVHGKNSYELDRARLNLTRIRRNVTHSQVTHCHIVSHARSLGLIDSPQEILSVSYMVNRIISLRLQPYRHPIEGDSAWRLVRLGVRASAERFDVSTTMILVYLVWFVGMATGPRPLAWRLAGYMVFPQARPRLNRVLQVLERA